MREAMAKFSGGSGDPSRLYKRVTVVTCTVFHLIVTLYVLRLLLASSSQGSTSFVDCLRDLYSYRSQEGKLSKQQLEYIKASIEFRRKAAPLVLILRVRDIEAEVAEKTKGQGPAHAVEKNVQQELREQKQLELAQQGPLAIEDDAVGKIQRLLPPDNCHPEPNTDFGGIAVRWGLTHHVNTAAECCKACSLQAAYSRVGQRKCNVWVFCPEKKGCPSPDGYEHKFGECWLKQADKPGGVVGDYSLVMRDKSAPPLPVLWISGVTPFNGG